jgi:hypothetical protein
VGEGLRKKKRNKHIKRRIVMENHEDCVSQIEYDQVLDALKAVLTAIPFPYDKSNHGFKCPICGAISKLPEGIQTHVDDCPIELARKFFY